MRTRFLTSLAVICACGSGQMLAGTTNEVPTRASPPRTQAAATRAPGQKTKLTIDGSSEDWKDYRTGWKGKTQDRPYAVIEGGRIDLDAFVNVTECDYANDQEYLYIFLKFNPSIVRRSAGSHPSGTVAYVLIGDASEAKQEDQTETARLQVTITFGVYSSSIGALNTSGCFVQYEIAERSDGNAQFSPPKRTESSRHPHPLINHGTDGVEFGLRLSDIHWKKGKKLNLIVVDSAFPEQHTHSIPLLLD